MTTPSRSPWLALAGVCLGVFMFTLDASIVNIAVPTLIRELHTNIQSVQWVIQSYLVTVVLLLLPMSQFAARLGQKTLFLAGLAIFTSGSLLCGMAGSVGALIAFRVVQSVGAACIAALMSSMAGAAFPPSRLAQALGIVTATATLGTSLGPTIGGFLIAIGSWHSIFLVNVPIGLFAFILVLATLPSAKKPPARSAPSLAECLGLLSDRVVRNGIAGRFASMMANGAFLFVTPLLLESALGYSTEKAGVFLAASPILIGITSPVFGALSDRYGRRPFLFAGVSAMIAGMLVMHTFSAGLSEAGFFLRVAVWAVGMGMFNAPNAAVVMSATSKNLADGASAMLSLAIVSGQLAGVAAGGVILREIAFRGHPGEQKLIDLPPAEIAAAVAGTLPVFALPLIGVLLLNILRQRRSRSEIISPTTIE